MAITTLEAIEMYSLATRRIPLEVVSLFSMEHHREGNKVVESECTSLNFGPWVAKYASDSGKMRHFRINYESKKIYRLYTREVRVPANAGHWMVQPSHGTRYGPRFPRTYAPRFAVPVIVLPYRFTFCLELYTMGRGNWFPGSNLDDCEVAYFDYANPDIEPDDTDAFMWEWQDARDTILNCLPESFIAVGCYRDLPNYCRTVNDRDSVPIAFNSLFTLWIDGQSDTHHTGLGFTVNENAPGFARSRMRQTAKAFFDKLAEIYPVRVRCCAWTSAPWPKSRDTANA